MKLFAIAVFILTSIYSEVTAWSLQKPAPTKSKASGIVEPRKQPVEKNEAPEKNVDSRQTERVDTQQTSLPLSKEIQEPFDISVKILPPSYQGHSYTRLSSVLWDRRHQLKKDEFETNAQHKARSAKIHTEPIMGRLEENSVYAFVEGIASKFLYDADTQTMSVKNSLQAIDGILLDKDDEKTFKHTPTAVLDSKVTSIDYYQGTNILGAVREVKQIEAITWALILSNHQSFDSIQDRGSYKWDFSISFTIPAEMARKAKPDLRLLYVCRLLPPHITLGVQGYKPTFDHPKELNGLMLSLPVELIEIRCFNVKTGEVYAVAKPRGETEELAHQEMKALDRCLQALRRIPARMAEGRTIFLEEYMRMRGEVQNEVAQTLMKVRDDRIRMSINAILAEFTFADQVWRSWNYEPLVANNVISKGWVKDKLVSEYGLKPAGIAKIIYLNDALLAVFGRASNQLNQTENMSSERKSILSQPSRAQRLYESVGDSGSPIGRACVESGLRVPCPSDSKGGEAYQAEILESRLVDYKDKYGKAGQMLLVDWKNVGSQPIGQIRATMTFYTADGTKISEMRDFPIFNASSEKNTVSPGATYKESIEDGFLVYLPTQMNKISYAKVTLTKVSTIPNK